MKLTEIKGNREFIDTIRIQLLNTGIIACFIWEYVECDDAYACRFIGNG